jgi:hypothetical protein
MATKNLSGMLCIEFINNFHLLSELEVQSNELTQSCILIGLCTTNQDNIAIIKKIKTQNKYGMKTDQREEISLFGPSLVPLLSLFGLCLVSVWSLFSTTRDQNHTFQVISGIDLNEHHTDNYSSNKNH